MSEATCVQRSLQMVTVREGISCPAGTGQRRLYGRALGGGNLLFSNDKTEDGANQIDDANKNRVKVTWRQRDLVLKCSVVK